jgi:hypothetical protein
VPMIPNRHLVVANMRTLIKLARCFEMPIVVAEHLPWVIGETVKELRELLDPKTPVIKKTVYNTFDDPRFTEAIEHTGRKQPLVLRDRDSRLSGTSCAGGGAARLQGFRGGGLHGGSDEDRSRHRVPTVLASGHRAHHLEHHSLRGTAQY